MKKISLFASTLTLVSPIFLAACKSHSFSPPTPQPRTYYDSLDLHSPDAAVTTLTNAFQRGDFPTVFWVFSPKAQAILRRDLFTLQYNHLLNLDASSDPDKASRPILEEGFLKPLSEQEHFGETSYLFDLLMCAAKEHDAFIIDLSQPVEIQKKTHPLIRPLSM